MAAAPNDSPNAKTARTSDRIHATSWPTIYALLAAAATRIHVMSMPYVVYFDTGLCIVSHVSAVPTAFEMATIFPIKIPTATIINKNIPHDDPFILYLIEQITQRRWMLQ